MAKTIKRIIEIDATREHVWSVLTDFPLYGQWNPFIRHISGDLAIGKQLHVHIVPKGGRGMKFKPTLTAATPQRELAWVGSLGMRGIFDGAHSFVLQDLSGGGTSVTQAETFRGILVPLFRRGSERTAAGFDDMNRALKERCETTDG